MPFCAVGRRWALRPPQTKSCGVPPGEFRGVSDVYCRGVAGDLPVHLDVVLTSSVHNHAREWHIAGEGVAVAREERRKRDSSRGHLKARADGDRVQFSSSSGWPDWKESYWQGPRAMQPTSRKPASPDGDAGLASRSSEGMRPWCWPRWASRNPDLLQSESEIHVDAGRD